MRKLDEFKALKSFEGVRYSASAEDVVLDGCKVRVVSFPDYPWDSSGRCTYIVDRNCDKADWTPSWFTPCKDLKCAWTHESGLTFTKTPEGVIIQQTEIIVYRNDEQFYHAISTDTESQMLADIERTANKVPVMLSYFNYKDNLKNLCVKYNGIEYYIQAVSDRGTIFCEDMYIHSSGRNRFMEFQIFDPELEYIQWYD